MSARARRASRPIAAARGFTLIELMVAISILAIISAIAFTGMSRVIDGSETARQRVEGWQAVQLAFRIITQDLSQIHPRTTRDELGDQLKPSLIASALEQYDVEFSRGGFANPVGLPRGTVLRVAYNLEGDELVRYYWPVTDRTFATTPFRRVLLKGVIGFEMTFIDAGGEAHIDWPPLSTAGDASTGQNTAALTLHPRAVRIAVELEGMGAIWRLIEVAG